MRKLAFSILLCLLLLSPAEAAVELVVNGSFASTTSGWTGADGTLASEAGGQVGNCLQLTRTAGDVQNAGQNITGMVVGVLYRVTAYVKSGTSGNEAYGIQGGNTSQNFNTTGTTTADWVLVSFTFTCASASGTGADLYLVKNSNTAGTMLFDEVSITRVPITWQGDDLTNPTYYNDADNWDTGTVPTTGDDVVLTGANNCNINAATAALNSFTMLGYTGHLTGTYNMAITVASGTSAVVFDNGADASNTWSGTLLLNPAAGTTINLTAGGWTTWGGITEAGTTTGQVIMLDGTSLAATKTVTLTSGTLHTDGSDDAQHLTHSWGLFSSNSGIARTLTPGDSVIGITGTGNVWLTGALFTLTANTATITFSGSNASFYGAGKVFEGSVAFAGSGAAVIRDTGNSFANLSATGTSVPTDSLTIWGNQTVTGSFSASGNSTTNRLLIYANTLGTPSIVTVTGATISADNIDVRDLSLNPGTNAQILASVADNGDGTVRFTTTGNHGLPTGTTKLSITGTDNYNGNYTATKVAATTFDITHAYTAETLGAGHTWTYDLTNGGANLIGDCGGNTGIHFTPATTQTCNDNASVAWSAATWTSHMPLPQDSVVISLNQSTAHTLTVDEPRIGGGGTGGITFGTATPMTLGNAVTSYGSVDLTGMGTFTPGSNAWACEIKDRTGTATLTAAGKTFWIVHCYAKSGSLALGSALTCASYLNIDYGTFADAGYSVSSGTVGSNAGGTPRAITKTGDWTLTASTGTMWSCGGSITVSDTAGTITISDAGASAKTFAGAGKAFNNVSFPSGSGGVIVTGANSFHNPIPGAGGIVTVAAGGKVVWPAGVTNNMDQLVANGTSGSHITFVSSTPSTQYTLNDLNGGQNKCSYLDVTDSIGTPANTWYWGVGGSGTRTTGWALGAAGVLHYYQQLLSNQ